MMWSRIFSAVLLAYFLGHSPAWGWGAQGHQLVGSIADQMPLNPRAQAAVSAILGFELRAAGPWLDCVRSVRRNVDGTFTYVAVPQFEPPCIPFENPAEQARIEDYAGRNWANCVYIDVRKHGCHESYHFADVAIQHDRYDRAFTGTNEHDIVSAISAAIAVLQDRPPPLPFSIRDKKEALFLLAHLVGDLHQPLHVGAVYLMRDGTPVDPDAPGTPEALPTEGGNVLFDGQDKLHHDWDEVAAGFGAVAGADLVQAAREIPPTLGPLESWPTVWASDTVVASHSAFSGLFFTPKPGHGPPRWNIGFQDRVAYFGSKARLQHDQLIKGGARLAQLLNAVWP